MSTGDIQQSPKKISKSSTATNISCYRLCKSVGDVSCSKNIYRTLLAAAEDIYGRPLRQDKLLPHLLCRPCERRLKNCFPFKTVISESQSSFETVKRYTEISPSVPRTAAKAVNLCVWKIFESSFDTAEWIKTTSTLVYYGGLASADWIILEYSWPSSLKTKVTWKERELDGVKIYWSVTGPSVHWTLQSMRRCDRLVAVCFYKLDLYSAKRRVEKETCSCYCVLNQCTWCAYKTPSILDNCLQLCSCRFILISLNLASLVFLRDTLFHVIRKMEVISRVVPFDCVLTFWEVIGLHDFLCAVNFTSLHSL